MSPATKLRVLFIIGKGRSGSTLLGDLLGSYPGVFHLGEAWRLWSHGLLGPHSCSCGAAAPECPVWGDILLRLRAGPSAWSVENPEEVVRLQRRLFGFGGVARSFVAGTYRDDLARYRDLAGDLYRAAAETTGARVLVDSSKWPLDPTLIDPSEDLEPSAVHLVRHPSSVAESWKKPKTFPDSETPMPRFGAVHTALSWTARTWTAERVVVRLESRGTTLRFEDFLAEPAGAIAELATLVGEEWTLEGSGSVRLKPGHTIMGNPSRFRSGEVALRPAASPPRDPLVAVLSWPWRRRFGYR